MVRAIILVKSPKKLIAARLRKISLISDSFPVSGQFDAVAVINVEELSYIKAKPIACKQCHGMGGSGQGVMSLHMNPKPRNFTCNLTMNTISDGQLFWIIKNGSKGTPMPSYSHLSNRKVWQLIHYIRSLSEEPS